MTIQDINKFFTSCLRVYLLAGYTINAGTMSGTQGELAKVDLTDGKEIVRAYIGKFHEYDKENISKSYDGLEIVVGRLKEKDIREYMKEFGCPTIWNKELEVITRYRAYSVGMCWAQGRAWYSVNRDDVDRAREKRTGRFMWAGFGESGYRLNLTPQMVERLKDKARKEFGVKKVSGDCITVYKDTTGYVMEYKEHVYRFH